MMALDRSHLRAPGVRPVGGGILAAALLVGGPVVLSAQGNSGGEVPQEGSSLTRWAQEYLLKVNRSLPGEDGRARHRLDRIRAMYFLSVEDGDWTEPALDSLRALEGVLPPESEMTALLQAYRGSLQVVRAKHARWPPNKLKYLNRGEDLLDEVVARKPGNLEARYLRLASYVFLPPFLKRDESVADDVEVLAAGLPERPQVFPPYLLNGVVRFVLENAALDTEARARLENLLDDGSSTLE